MNEETKKLLNSFAKRYGLKFENYENSTEFFALLFVAIMKEELEFREHVNGVLEKLANPRMLVKPDRSIEPLGYFRQPNDLSVSVTPFEEMLTKLDDDGKLEHIPDDFFETIVEEEGNNPSCAADTMEKAKGFTKPGCVDCNNAICDECDDSRNMKLKQAATYVDGINDQTSRLGSKVCFKEKIGDYYECMACNATWPVSDNIECYREHTILRTTHKEN